MIKGRRAGAQAQIWGWREWVSCRFPCLSGWGRGTYDSEIDLDGGGNPERKGEPGLIVADYQALPDVVCSDRTGYDDDEPEAEEDDDADAVVDRHLKPRDDGDWEYGDQEIYEAVHDADTEHDFTFVEAVSTWRGGYGPICADRPVHLP